MRAPSKMEEKLDKILNLLDNLSSESARGVLIIVEGKKDVECLHELEIEGDIIAVKAKGRNSSDRLSEIEERAEDEVILLLDFDRRGREMTKYLTQRFEEMKIRSNITFWKELSALLRRDVKDIEGLPAYIETLRRKIGKI